MRERRVEVDGVWKEPDKDLKMNSVQKHLITFARKHNGKFTVKDYERHLKDTVGDIKQREYLLIRKNNACLSLVNAGYLAEKKRGEYEVNPLVLKSFDENMRKAAFAIKANHKKLLMNHKDGVITKSDLKKEHAGKSEKEQYRQDKFIDGMIRNLKENDYLENLGNGRYKLTPLGQEVISGSESLLDNKGPVTSKMSEHSSKVKITSFDRVFLEVSENGKLKKELVDSHIKKDSIYKRIETLKTAGFIKENSLSEALIQRMGLVKERSRQRTFSFDRFSPEQQQLLKDMSQFQNIYRGQIIKYIYKGNASQADMDIQFMVDSGLLKKDKLWDIYVLGDEGIRMTNSFDPEAVRYKTKVYSRREEVGHDAMVYTTFKHFEGRVAAENMEILQVKTDRQLRSEDGKAYGSMQGAYPDLLVSYRDPITQKVFSEGLEVDIQYDQRTIQDKVEKILMGRGSSGSKSGSRQDQTGSTNNAGTSDTDSDSKGTNQRKASSNSKKTNQPVNSLSWYCNKASQVAKVIKVFDRIFSDPKSRNASKAKNLKLFFIDEDGKVHKVKWR